MPKKNVIVSAFFVLTFVLSGWSSGYAVNQATDAGKGDAIKAQNTGEESQPPTGVPQISFMESSYDFGKVTQGAKPSHKFIVKNTGDAPLKLIKAKGS